MLQSTCHLCILELLLVELQGKGRKIRAQQLEGDKLGHCWTSRKGQVMLQWPQMQAAPRRFLLEFFVEKWWSRSKSGNKFMEDDLVN